MIQEQEELRVIGRKRIIFMKRYLEEEGDPRQITIKDEREEIYV